MNLTTTTLGRIHENTWNPNRQSDEAFAAEIESIKRFGFIDPITVRKHPERRGSFEIVDGAHRYRALTELGWKDEVPVVVIDVTDAEAQALTVVLNETRGQADRIDLANLLARLHDTDDELLAVLPYSQKEFDDLLAAATTSLPEDDFSGAFDKVQDGEPEFVTMTFTIPAEAKADVDEALATAKSVMGDVDGNVNGHALVAICRHHLTGE